VINNLRLIYLFFRTDKLKIIMNKNSVRRNAGIWSLDVGTGAFDLVAGSLLNYARKDGPALTASFKSE